MKVTSYVYVTHNGRSIRLAPGDTVPEGVAVTNPDVIDADSVAAGTEAADKAAEKAPARKSTAKAAPASE